MSLLHHPVTGVRAECASRPVTDLLDAMEEFNLSSSSQGTRVAYSIIASTACKRLGLGSHDMVTMSRSELLDELRAAL